MAKTRSQRSRSVRPSEKATFHQIAGAGKAHVLRKFFGIAPSDEALITRELGVTVDRNLARDAQRSA